MIVTNRGITAAPWGLAGMLALVVVFEWAHAWQGLDVPNATDDWIRNKRLAARYARPYEVLLLGDSALKFGVAPTLIEGRTGRRCYNLAVLAGSPVTSFVLLRQALDAGAKPSAIVIESLPHVLALDPRTRSQKRWPRLLSFRDAFELALTARDPGLIGPYVVDRLLPTNRERENLRAGLLAALNGQLDWRRRFFSFHNRNWDRNLGAQILQVVNNPINAEAEYRLNFPTPWSCHPVNAVYTRRLLDLAASRGIKVYWLLPPIDPGVQALCDRNGQEARFDRFVDEMAGERENLVVIDARRAGFDRSQLVDWAHVNRRGAIALSESLADELNRPGPGAGPRFVQLPPNRGPQEALAIEDIDQSRIAIEAGGAIRR